MDYHVTLLILHIIGAGLLIGVVVFSLSLAFKKTWSQNRIHTLHYIGTFGIWASMWQLVTGVLLASSEWEEFSGSHIFWTKMGLYVVEGVLASMLIMRKAKQLQEGDSKPGFMVLLLIHTILILGIVGIGVFLVSGESH